MFSQELESKYLIPAIRRELVLLMLKKGIKKSEIAIKLKLTKSAISQYFSDKRGNNFKLDSYIVKNCCDNIISGKNCVSEIQDLIKNLKKTRNICGIYKNNNLKPDDCEVCENGIFR
ncbi:hypothetical protein KY334_02785 [Candidatus Woesearchaeota archaeon]|nr:hypothetical protein [Candidatus Woesearchaeota archaeon]